MSKFKQVVPNKNSNPNYFEGKWKDEVLNLKYGERDFKQVQPNKSSNFRNYIMESQWNGISRFYDRVEDLEKDLYKSYEEDCDYINHKPTKETILEHNKKVDEYPKSDRYNYTSYIERINYDKECTRDFQRGKGILITEPQGPKKDTKSMSSIYSPLFGAMFDDVDNDGNKFRCSCGYYKGRQREGSICPKCGGTVTFKGDDFDIWGWMVLENDVIINPNIYKEIQFYVGGKRIMENMIKAEDERDENGFIMNVEKPEDEPFYAIGMVEFCNKFPEILSYYKNKNGEKKRDRYDELLEEFDKGNIFIHSIPCYTTLLRPYRVKDDKFIFNDVNANFNMMAKLVAILNNKRNRRISRAKKTRDQLLFSLQENLNFIFDEVIKIMSSKRGIVRSLYGGRCNFTSRSVIVPDWTLEVDQVKLSYFSLVKLLELTIINILHHTYGMVLHEARDKWELSFRQFNPDVENIINYVLHSYPRGLPILINRPPTITFGSILQMYCIGIDKNYTMSLPLLILPTMNADFD